jgi:hypothetical protein
MGGCEAAKSAKAAEGDQNIVHFGPCSSARQQQLFSPLHLSLLPVLRRAASLFLVGSLVHFQPTVSQCLKQVPWAPFFDRATTHCSFFLVQHSQPEPWALGKSLKPPGERLGTKVYWFSVPGRPRKSQNIPCYAFLAQLLAEIAELAGRLF